MEEASEATSAPAFSLVLPLYNEEGAVRRVVGELLDAFDGQGYDYELLLVVNGSMDGTGAACDEMARRFGRIRLVRVPINQGYGNGVLAGLSRARGALVGFMAGDGQIRPADVCRVVDETLTGRADLVKAARAGRTDSLYRRVQSRCYNWTIRCLFSVRSRDTHGIPKFLRRESLAGLQLSARDWFLDDEVMIKARVLGFSVREIPVAWVPRAGGRSHVRPLDVLEFLANLVIYRLWRVPRWRRELPRS